MKNKIIVLGLFVFGALLQAAEVVNETTSVTGTYTVPNDTQLMITIKGADGGDAAEKGGEGATVSATFNVTAGQVIGYIVGEVGYLGTNNSAGGGGSTGVYIDNTLVMVAGAGGGGDNSNNAVGLGGNDSEDGDAGTGNGAGAGGTGGDGGDSGRSAGGGGVNTAGGGGNGGEGATGAITFALGGSGTNNSNGGQGFTGGGGAANYYSAGAAGYSGGGGAGGNGSAGGGGSYLNTSYVGYISGNMSAGNDGSGSESDGSIIVETFIDTDGDGVRDDVDVDDDNDGILDINESTLDKTDFELHGDATQVSENEVRLTADSNNQFGTSMSIRTVDLSHNFTIDAEIYLGTKNNGADGISFVLHNDPDGSSAIGTGEGSTLGSMANSSTVGIRNGLSIEFDTYQSSSGSDDPADDHTQIRDTDYSFNDTGGRVTNVTALNNLEDGNWHIVHLEWNAATFELSYAIDGVSMPGITDTDIATNYFDGSSSVYYGFTAATGGLNNVQSIRYVSSSSLKDTDNDGIYNSFDLDSDNDGIPDNVEAQPTTGFLKANIAWADDDNDGLANQYDPDFAGSTPVVLPDTDGDGIRDNLDSDSDNDGYTDCEEGFPDATSGKSCPISNTDTNLGTNGMINWAGSDGYWDTDHAIANGNIDDPSSDLFNEVGNTTEVGYREFLCGKKRITLTHLQWRLISFPCDTDTHSIMDLLGNSLGTDYETDWEMWKQDGTDSYEVNATHKNTHKTKMNETDTVIPGKSYWIIVDTSQNGNAVGNEVNVTIPKNLTNLAPTSTTSFTSDPDFTKVHLYTLPVNSNQVKKYMTGNPFPFSFHMSDLYFKHDVSTGTYYAMGSASNDTYIDATVYTHDSSDTSNKNTTNSGGYKAVNASTPGLDGSIVPMEGFFVKIKDEGSNVSNLFAYPLMTK